MLRWALSRRRLAAGALLALALATAAWMLSPDRKPFRADMIVVHHSDSPTEQDGRPVDAAAIDCMHADRGFRRKFEGKVYHIGYHYVILPDGTVEAGRPVGCMGAHAKPVNRRALGICLVGSFSTGSNPDGARGPLQPTPHQERALVRLCADLVRRQGIAPENIIPHSDVGDTECPGDRFPLAAFREALQRELAAAPASAHAPP